jgi:hypothetical protein
MLFVERINGRVESKSAQLREVRRIEPSKSKQHLLKVRLRIEIYVNLFAHTVTACSYLNSKLYTVKYTNSES